MQTPMDFAGNGTFWILYPLEMKLEGTKKAEEEEEREVEKLCDRDIFRRQNKTKTKLKMKMKKKFALRQEAARRRSKSKYNNK